jgi:hypothetical protein
MMVTFVWCRSPQMLRIAPNDEGSYNWDGMPAPGMHRMEMTCDGASSHE